MDLLYWVVTVVFIITVFLPITRINSAVLALTSVVFFLQTVEIGATNLMVVYAIAVLTNTIVLLFGDFEK
tara:strand:+ start:10783 stop:10992 length:210 start_codon:yes stop_codon:yes gene_type:complete